MCFYFFKSILWLLAVLCDFYKCFVPMSHHMELKIIQFKLLYSFRSEFTNPRSAYSFFQILTSSWSNIIFISKKLSTSWALLRVSMMLVVWKHHDEKFCWKSNHNLTFSVQIHCSLGTGNHATGRSYSTLSNLPVITCGMQLFEVPGSRKIQYSHATFNEHYKCLKSLRMERTNLRSLLLWLQWCLRLGAGRIWCQ
mgnify:CR=1 FL=1